MAVERSGLWAPDALQSPIIRRFFNVGLKFKIIEKKSQGIFWGFSLSGNLYTEFVGAAIDLQNDMLLCHTVLKHGRKSQPRSQGHFFNYYGSGLLENEKTLGTRLGKSNLHFHATARAFIDVAKSKGLLLNSFNYIVREHS